MIAVKASVVSVLHKKRVLDSALRKSRLVLTEQDGNYSKYELRKRDFATEPVRADEGFMAIIY